jgi:hypothetical protein
MDGPMALAGALTAELSLGVWSTAPMAAAALSSQASRVK